MGPDHKNLKILTEYNSFIIICNVNKLLNKYLSSTNDLERLFVLRALSTQQWGGGGEPKGGPVITFILSYPEDMPCLN